MGCSKIEPAECRECGPGIKSVTIIKAEDFLNMNLKPHWVHEFKFEGGKFIDNGFKRELTFVIKAPSNEAK